MYFFIAVCPELCCMIMQTIPLIAAATPNTVSGLHFQAGKVKPRMVELFIGQGLLAIPDWAQVVSPSCLVLITRNCLSGHTCVCKVPSIFS